MSAMAIVSIVPLGDKESVSEYVARCVRVIKKSGLEWQITPMGTIIAGENIQQIFDVVAEAVEELKECNRISVSVKVDYRRNRQGSLDDKVKSVLTKL